MEVDDPIEATTVVSIQIPQDAEAGDTISFVVDGQNFDFPIPAGSEPGDILEIQLAQPNQGHATANETNKDYSTFVMSSGVELTVPTHVGSFTPNDVSVLSSCGRSNDGTYALIWPSTRYALQYINSHEFVGLLRDKEVRSVLELGAGHHGLFGMAFAVEVASQSPNRGTIKVTLTDTYDAVPHLKRNIVRNSHVFGERVNISAACLVWHTLPVPSYHCEVDWIIGSDLLYRYSNIPALVATITRLRTNSTRLLLSVRWRKPEEERAFFVLLSDLIEWTVVRGYCQLDYKEYGNPACNESNRFFSQTMVGVGGKLTPLASIDEASSEQMTTDEFEKFEYIQTQIYLGSVKNKLPTTTRKIEVTDSSSNKRPRIAPN